MKWNLFGQDIILGSPQTSSTLKLVQGWAQDWTASNWELLQCIASNLSPFSAPFHSLSTYGATNQYLPTMDALCLQTIRATQDASGWPLLSKTEPSSPETYTSLLQLMRWETCKWMPHGHVRTHDKWLYFESVTRQMWSLKCECYVTLEIKDLVGFHFWCIIAASGSATYSGSIELELMWLHLTSLLRECFTCQELYIYSYERGTITREDNF